MTGDNIAQIREAYCWTARELAQVLGVSEGSVYRWEGEHEDELTLDPRHEQMLLLLAQDIARREAQQVDPRELGGVIAGAIMVGGALFGLFKLLEAVFQYEGPRARGTRGKRR